MKSVILDVPFENISPLIKTVMFVVFFISPMFFVTIQKYLIGYSQGCARVCVCFQHILGYSVFQQSEKCCKIMLYSVLWVVADQNVVNYCSRLRLVVKMDQTFVSRFGQESSNVMRRVLAHAQEYFNLPSLVTKIKLQVDFLHTVLYKAASFL